MSSQKEYIRPISVQENVEPRLISSVSRTGRVIYQDDFEAYTAAITEKWIQTAATISLDTAFPFRGKACMKLLTTNVAANAATASKIIGSTNPRRIGIEFWWCIVAAATTPRYLDIALILDNGSSIQNAFWRCSFNVSGTPTGIWRYRDFSNTEYDIAGSGPAPTIDATNKIWHHFKGTAEVVNGMYISLITDDHALDMSAKTTYTPASGGNRQLTIQITLTTDVAIISTAYIDDLIITDLEP